MNVMNSPAEGIFIRKSSFFPLSKGIEGIEVAAYRGNRGWAEEAEGKIEEVKWKRWFPETFAVARGGEKFLSCREIERKSSDRRRRGRLPPSSRRWKGWRQGHEEGRKKEEGWKRNRLPSDIADETGAIYLHHCRVSFEIMDNALEPFSYPSFHSDGFMILEVMEWCSKVGRDFDYDSLW